MEPPSGLVAVQIPKALLLLTLDEYTRGIRRGKWWRRRQAMLAREATSAAGPVVASGGVSESQA